MTRPRWPLRTAVAAVLAVVLLSEPGLAHAGSLRLSQEPVSVPFWLVLLTGGGIVGASFLLASLATDHDFIRAINEWHVRLPDAASIRPALLLVARAFGVLALAGVLAIGLLGPQEAMANAATLFVWAGWWAGFTMSVYLVGNSWPLFDPWRTIAAQLPRLRERPYPERLGAWPSVVGLLALVLLEVVSPVADDPRWLAGIVLAYTAVTLAGAAVFGTDAWFGNVDPIARVFRVYGRVAPIQRTDDGVEFTLPGTALVAASGPAPVDETAFVVALLWATTYDGLISTPLWGSATEALVGLGAPPLAVYLGAIVGGFGLFFGGYRLAARLSRRTANSYVSPAAIEARFAPSLLPIAAGYHLAHFLGLFLTLLPALVAVSLSPLSPPAQVPVLAMPGWFGVVSLLAIIVGHLVAIWVAHGIAFSLFTGRLQPIRSQYPIIVAMILYTMTSMWIVAQPVTAPPYV